MALEQLTPVVENELHVEPIMSERLRVASVARHVLATHNGFQQRMLRLSEKNALPEWDPAAQLQTIVKVEGARCLRAYCPFAHYTVGGSAPCVRLESGVENLRRVCTGYLRVVDV